MAKESAGYYRYKVTISIIAASIFLLSQCINAGNNTETKKDTTIPAKVEQIVTAPGYELYAGSAACSKCHQDIHNHFIHTAHHLTSEIATNKNIKGSFAAGNNTFFYTPNTAVTMEKRNDSFYQVLYYGGIEQKAKPLDIVVGSGTMGQSFLYWQNNSLFQLPITYFTAAKAWSNSPGFPNRVVYDRDITSRCLECHSTFAKTISVPGKQTETFDRNKIIYGVECEKCHGPAARHIAFQSQNPDDTTGKFIINPAKLSRQQNLDICALCHGGRLQKTTPSFSFIAGDTLSDFFALNTEIPNPNSIDVHGNQYGLLRASKCFRMSNAMTCNTCHNTHNNEKGQQALFSARCINCHSNNHNTVCKLEKTLGNAIRTNCIDCHMPLNPSRAIAVFLPGKTEPVAALIRTHYISIYPEETKKVLAYMKKLPEAKK
jgi:hypothetical protein